MSLPVVRNRFDAEIDDVGNPIRSQKVMILGVLVIFDIEISVIEAYLGCEVVSKE